MQNYTQKIPIVIILGLILLSTSGCSKMTQKSVDLGSTKTESSYTYQADEDTEDLETINVYNDLDTFITLNNQEATELANLDNETDMEASEKTQKKNAVITNYVVNLYKLASSRVSADVETVYANTENYQSYIALLQTFVDTMTSESEEFDQKMSEGDSSISDMDSFKAMTNVENFYMDLYEYVQNGKISSKSSNSKSSKNETKKLSEALGKDIRGEKSSSSSKKSSTSSKSESSDD